MALPASDMALPGEEVQQTAWTVEKQLVSCRCRCAVPAVVRHCCCCCCLLLLLLLRLLPLLLFLLPPLLLQPPPLLPPPPLLLPPLPFRRRALCWLSCSAAISELPSVARGSNSTLSI